MESERSDIKISRNNAINLILVRMNRHIYEEMDSEQLCEMIEKLGYGVDKELPYYGCKIIVEEKTEEVKDIR
jgi:hypothetical protein